MLTILQSRVRLLCWTSLSMPGRAEQTTREMGAIVQAIEAKDADAAAAACATHVRNAAATALARMAEASEPLGRAHWPARPGASGRDASNRTR